MKRWKIKRRTELKALWTPSRGKQSSTRTVTLLSPARHTDSYVFFSRNDIFKSLLDGTDWKLAVDVAEKGENCSAAFASCPNELVTVISAVSKYLVSSL